MKARYLLRFDDICPTLKWSTWDRVTAIMDRAGVRPLLAVVPDNVHPKLVVDPPNPRFWDLVREGQARGWTIAMHGYQHDYVSKDAGIVGLNPYGEFAGLPYDEQRDKIEKGLAIFAREKVRADAWIAPAHAFDESTIRALLEHRVRVISDGFYWRPVQKLGATWIPQQLWQFRRFPFGVWTVCFHPNELSEEKIAQFERDVEAYRDSIVSVDEVLRLRISRAGVLDEAFSRFWLWKAQGRKRNRPKA